MSPTVHEKFNDSDADVLVQSSDGVSFQLHKRYLEVNAGAFPPREFQTNGEVVFLSEPARVLQEILEYVYPRRHPDWEDKTFEEMAEISEAVEKYEVYPAMAICIVRLRTFIPQRALEVLGHAIKHDYPKLMDESAPHLVLSPLVPIFEKLPSSWVFPWLRYSEANKATIFSPAKSLVNNTMRPYQSCLRGENDLWICNTCRAGLLVWITDLETMESLALIRDSVEDSKHENYPRRPHCGTCSAKGCMHMSEVVKVLKEGLDNFRPLSKFLTVSGNDSQSVSDKIATAHDTFGVGVV